uniref:Uncharacterized protein n=1 Tax=Arundo donax TaxID=35708 RepID=A0A0A8YJX8_ARUDO
MRPIEPCRGISSVPIGRSEVKGRSP